MTNNSPTGDDGTEIPVDVTDGPSQRGRRDGARERLEEGADRAVEGFDQGIVDLLAWILETETRARIYVYLRQFPGSTSEEVAEGTGLYPSTVREALADLNSEGTVSRVKRESEGAGNNPYEYTAIAPSELVKSVVSQVQDELNTVLNLDRYLDRDQPESDSPPISISVDVHEETDETSDDDEPTPNR